MCGIFGFIGFRDSHLLGLMGKSLAHRGPDDEDYFSEGLVNLGYRRLAIIDVTGSYQPLFNEDRTVVLLFNGEVYNYKDLQNELSSRKHKLATNGDGETIVHRYEDLGVESFFGLNGMFGFALYDKKRGQVYLVRDHFGIKPLYYAEVNGKLIFGSEIKAILVAFKKLGIPIVPNDRVINRYLLTRAHDDGKETFFANIFRVPANCYLRWDVDSGNSSIQTYWPESLRPKYKLDGKNPVENFRKLFLDSVRIRLMSEVPLGTALSGGLDSTAVVGAVASQLKQADLSDQIKDKNRVIGPRQKTFSAVFPGEINNEETYIKDAISATGVANYQVKPDRKAFWKDLEKFIAQQDEPIISSGHYAQWKVMELAAKHKIRVMLDGQGADEMLAGYIPYYFVYFRELIKSFKLFKLIKEIILSLDLWWPLVWQKRGIKAKDLFNIDSAIHGRPMVGLNDRLKRDVFYDSLPALLRYEDHDSMAFSIESRVPFLDYRLWDFVNHLGSEFKIRNGWNKWIMREGLKDILPPKIRQRRWKVGFTTPEVHWFRQSEREINEIFASASFNRRPYFKPDKIRKAYKEFREMKSDDSMVFWRIINLELWMRKFID